MTREEEALQEARRRWGPLAYARMVSVEDVFGTKDRTVFYEVGPDAHEKGPTVTGASMRSFEDAFADADHRAKDA